MKKLGAFATAAAVAATTLTAAPAFAATTTQTAILECKRLIHKNGRTIDGQTPVPVELQIEAPEKVTEGESYSITITPQVEEGYLLKSASQAQDIAGVKKNTKKPYDGDPVTTNFTNRVVEFTYANEDGVAAAPLLDTEWWVNQNSVNLGTNTPIQVLRTAGAAGTKDTITSAKATFTEQVKVNENQINRVSTWTCTINPVSGVIVEVPVEAAKADDTTPPATQPGVGSSLGGLLPLLALILSIFAAFKHLFNFNGLFGSR